MCIISCVLSLDSDDDFCSGCQNISHHNGQQSFSGLNYTNLDNRTTLSNVLAMANDVIKGFVRFLCILDPFFY